MKTILKTLGVALAACGMGATANAEPWFGTFDNGNGKETITAYMDQDIPNVVDVDIQPGNIEFIVNGIPYNVPVSSAKAQIRLGIFGGDDIDIITVTGVDLEAQATPSFVGPNWFKMEIFLQDGADFFENQTANRCYVDAGNGNDLCIGGPGSDAFEGGDGDDNLQGNGDNDLLEGQRGNDVLDGGEGPDVLIGGIGLDQMNGGPGDDFLIGNVILEPGKSRPDYAPDQMFGDTGADTFYYRHFKYVWGGYGPYQYMTEQTQETDDVHDYMPREGDTLESLETLAYTFGKWSGKKVSVVQKVSKDDLLRVAK